MINKPLEKLVDKNVIMEYGLKLINIYLQLMKTFMYVVFVYTHITVPIIKKISSIPLKRIFPKREKLYFRLMLMPELEVYQILL